MAQHNFMNLGPGNPISRRAIIRRRLKNAIILLILAAGSIYLWL